MKARIPAPKQLRKSVELETTMLVSRELEKQRDDMTRKLFKIFCVALNRKYRFGLKRLSTVIFEMTELIKQSDSDPVFWEHMDRLLIDKVGMEFDRDYTE